MANQSEKPLTTKLLQGLPSSKLAPSPTYPEQVTVPSGTVRRELEVIPPYAEIRYKDELEETYSVPRTPTEEITSAIISTTENGAFSSTLWTTTLTAAVRVQYVTFGGMITAGSMAYYRLELRIRQASGAGSYYFVLPVYFQNNAGYCILPLNGYLLPVGTEISLHARRSVVAATHEVKVHIVVIEV